MSSKQCLKCGEEKPVSAFSVDRSRHDGLNSYCRECLKVKKTADTAKKVLGDMQVGIMRAIRHNGIKYADLLDRFGLNAKGSLNRLKKAGLVEFDAEGYYTLTPSGKAACPCRNRHYARRFGYQAESSGVQA